nr:immunoglobulin heavy chain junction region [Macaca mulatta]MOW80835.1 immunoglobulin heavy chain junction region [Macaca mulatta]MOW81305.1 immunoglobulin heavy chain junction region [Macaca mulatta]MOW84699.1 immunoglobulin heavy chain junction region [Macaca mulatta]
CAHSGTWIPFNYW